MKKLISGYDKITKNKNKKIGDLPFHGGHTVDGYHNDRIRIVGRKFVNVDLEIKSSSWEKAYDISKVEERTGQPRYTTLA